MKALNELKQGLEDAWASVHEGWRRLSESAAGAITRFKPGHSSAGPSSAEVDDVLYIPSQRWAMLTGDVFEDEKRLVVRLEVPGMEKEDFNIEVRDQALVISGEKRFEREGSEGRYRVLQCAYGAFHRVIPLPTEVVAEEAEASYRNGVLKVVLPKAHSEPVRTVSIRVG